MYTEMLQIVAKVNPLLQEETLHTCCYAVYTFISYSICMYVYIRILYIIYKPWCGLCVLVIYIDMFMTSPEMGMRAPSIHI